MKQIKIFGERNTGTNYLSKLIQLNTNVELMRGTVPPNKLFTFSEFAKNCYFAFTAKNNLGWKHSQINIDLVLNHKNLENIHFVTITKNPYSFLLSLYKKPYHTKSKKASSFLEFLQTKWLVQYRDCSAESFYATPIHLWNEKNKSYLTLKNQLPNKTLNLTYENVLKDYIHELEIIFDFCTIEKNVPFKNVVESTKEKSKSHSDYQEYYLNENWRNDIQVNEIAFINQYLNMDVMKAFNYKLL